MGTSKKKRNKIMVADRLYLWYVKQDEDSASYILHVISDDKGLIVKYYLHQEEAYRHLIVLGKEFGRVAGTGNCWRRFRCPAWERERVITPSSVRRLIEWSQQTDGVTEEVDYTGWPVPLGGHCASCAGDLRGMVPFLANSCPKCGQVIPERRSNQPHNQW